MQEVARARHLTLAQVAQLEEAWRSNPDASLAELSKPSAEDEPAPVALRCASSPSSTLALSSAATSGVWSVRGNMQTQAAKGTLSLGTKCCGSHSVLCAGFCCYRCAGQFNYNAGW